jgi:hypothetical protein
MPETHRENRHRADTAQRKTCQTVQNPDMYNHSFPGPEICESGPGQFPSVAAPIIGISGGGGAMRKPELELKLLLALPELGLQRGAPGADVWTVPIPGRRSR